MDSVTATAFVNRNEYPISNEVRVKCMYEGCYHEVGTVRHALTAGPVAGMENTRRAHLARPVNSSSDFLQKMKNSIRFREHGQELYMLRLNPVAGCASSTRKQLRHNWLRKLLVREIASKKLIHEQQCWKPSILSINDRWVNRSSNENCPRISEVLQDAYHTETI